MFENLEIKKGYLQINVTEEDEIYHSFYGLRIYFVRNQCNFVNTNLQTL